MLQRQQEGWGEPGLLFNELLAAVGALRSLGTPCCWARAGHALGAAGAGGILLGHGGVAVWVCCTAAASARRAFGAPGSIQSPFSFCCVNSFALFWGEFFILFFRSVTALEFWMV